MSAIAVNKNNFEQEVINSDRPVLLDFFAVWCGPCRMLSPIVEKISNEHSEYKVCKVNVDEEPELAEKFEVMSIPSLFVVKNGQIVNSSVGALPEAQILAMLK